jgi:hypothetical protein
MAGQPLQSQYVELNDDVVDAFNGPMITEQYQTLPQSSGVAPTKSPPPAQPPRPFRQNSMTATTTAAVATPSPMLSPRSSGRGALPSLPRTHSSPQLAARRTPFRRGALPSLPGRAPPGRQASPLASQYVTSMIVMAIALLPCLWRRLLFCCYVALARVAKRRFCLAATTACRRRN